jgi:hypothetical protein
VGRGFVEFRSAEAVDVVTLDDADALKAGKTERFTEVVEEVALLGVVGGFFSTKMRFISGVTL